MRATVVIVTYNHVAVVGACLHAVLATVPADVETVVIDNASWDGTADMVRRDFPAVRVVQSGENTGYGGGNNVGAARARGEILVFLNPDTQPREGWLEPLLDELQDESVGLATPKLLLASDPSRIDTLGNEVHLSGITPSRKWGEPASDYRETHEVSAISGACFAVRREVFDELGGFDERYFLYFEDTDLSLRARLAGYRCLAVPASQVLHDHRPGFSPEKLRYLERNRYWTLLKLLEVRTLVALLPALLLAEALAWGLALKSGPVHVAAKARAWWELIGWLPRLAVARHRVGGQRRVSDAELLRLHSTRLALGQAAGGALAGPAERLVGEAFRLSRVVAALGVNCWGRSESHSGASERLKIAHVTATFPPYWGGTGNVAWHNAREMARLGHDVTVFTAASSELGVAGAHDPEGVRVNRLRPLVQIGNAPLLPGLVGALGGFDLIHLHYPFFFGAELVWLASRLWGVPYVITFHNALIGDGRRAVLFRMWERTFSRLVFAGARCVLAVSLDHAASTPWLAEVARDPLVEVPNGVDTLVFRGLPVDQRRRHRERLGIGPNEQVLLFVAALDRAHHFKGLSLLLCALAELRDRSMILVVVGDGDLRARYEREAVDLGIAHHVQFAGAVPHESTAAYFGAADALVLPTSPPESFGLVLIEALACGTPVVASDIPGVRDVVARTGGGVLFPVGDAKALARAIAELLEDPEWRGCLATAGQEAVVTRYAWSAIGPRLEAAYRACARSGDAVVKVREANGIAERSRCR